MLEITPIFSSMGVLLLGGNGYGVGRAGRETCAATGTCVFINDDTGPTTQLWGDTDGRFRTDIPTRPTVNPVFRKTGFGNRNVEVPRGIGCRVKNIFCTGMRTGPAKGAFTFGEINDRMVSAVKCDDAFRAGGRTITTSRATGIKVPCPWWPDNIIGLIRMRRRYSPETGKEFTTACLFCVCRHISPLAPTSEVRAVRQTSDKSRLKSPIHQRLQPKGRGPGTRPKTESIAILFYAGVGHLEFGYRSWFRFSHFEGRKPFLSPLCPKRKLVFSFWGYRAGPMNTHFEVKVIPVRISILNIINYITLKL